MRKLFFLTIIATCSIYLFLSCGTNEEQKYNLKVMAINESIPLQDTIFLNYRLGMSNQEFYKHSEKLLDQNEITFEGKGIYSYYFDFGNYESFTANIQPSFYKDKLFKLTLTAEHDLGIVCYLNLSSLLHNKYQKLYYNHLYKKENYAAWHSGKKEITNEEFYFNKWLFGKTEIRIEETFRGATLTYTDLYTEKLKFTELKIKQKQKQKSMTEDL